MNDTSQYFDEDPSVESKPVSFTRTICGEEYEFKTDRGVFAKGSLDKATEVLIKEFNDNYVGTPKSIVDVGAGYGPLISFAAKKFSDARIIAIEPNERARSLCNFNYKKNVADTRLEIYTPADVPQDLKCDLIISNPPIRIGKVALYELLSFWSNRLESNGEIWLVMSKNLGADSCAKFLETECGLRVTRIASKKGFRVLSCTRS